jgi:hypothetical protein
MMDVINSKIEALTAYKNFINNKICNHSAYAKLL